MKRLIQICLIVLFLALPFFSQASYIIYLNNGSQYIVNQYSEYNEQIMLYFYEGILGIPKCLIKNIEESDLAVFVPRERKDLSESYSGGDIDGLYNEKISEEIPEEERDDERFYIYRKASLDRQLKEALKKYKMVKGLNSKEMIYREFRNTSKISAECEDLRKKVRQKYNGVLPEWWHSESGSPH